MLDTSEEQRGEYSARHDLQSHRKGFERLRDLHRCRKMIPRGKYAMGEVGVTTNKNREIEERSFPDPTGYKTKIGAER